MNRDALVALSRRELRALLERGHPLDPAALDDTEYHGTALGNPAWVTRLSWLKFFKVFRRRADGRLVGWNAAAEQNGLAAPWVLRRRADRPITYWAYEVRAPRPDERTPYDTREGLIIDYALGDNPAWDTIRWMKDPLVAVHPGSPELLLGVSYLRVGPLAVHTPTFFCLERGGPLSHDR